MSLVISFPALATDFTFQKLTGKWSGNAESASLGFTFNGMIACNDRWIVAGAPYASESLSNAGAVQVFSASTGAWVRTLHGPGTASANRFFGGSCALSGNLALIGETGHTTSGAGTVHVFDLISGKLVRSLKPAAADDVAGNQFGIAIAVGGGRVLVSAQGGITAAFVFDLGTGTLLHKLTSPVSSSFFASAVAVDGDLGLIGDFGVDGKGAGYLFDLTTGNLIRKLQPASTLTGAYLGSAVALGGGKAVLGAPGSSTRSVVVIDLLSNNSKVLTPGQLTTAFGGYFALDGGLLVVADSSADSSAGAVFTFDLSSAATTPLQKISTVQNGIYFGSSVGLYGSTLLVGAPGDDTLNTDAGAIFVARQVVRPMPLTRIAAKGDFAPGAADITFNTIGDVFINPAGHVGFVSTLAGAGSNGGKDNGLFTSMPSNGAYLDLVIKSRQLDQTGNQVAAVSKPLMNYAGRCGFQASLTGAGVTVNTNVGYYSFVTGSLALQYARKGFAPVFDGGPVYASFLQTLQSRADSNLVSLFNYQIGIGGVTSANDSGILQSFSFTTEGDLAAGTTEKHGQFSPRCAAYYDRTTYATALSGPSAANAAVFQLTTAKVETLVARKGDLAPGGTAPFAAFIGESSDYLDTVLYRATLGAPTTSANNEGLWIRTVGGVHSLVMRKGDSISGLPATAKIAKFINYWRVSSRSLTLVQLSGAGVNSSNDLALLCTLNGNTFPLLREGWPAPGCVPATIGVISRIEVEPFFGQYLVLTTLVGAPVGTELALLRGSVVQPVGVIPAEHRPYLVLRKGQLFANQPSPLKSISLPTTNVTASGAGNVGLGSCIQEPQSSSSTSPIVIAVDYANGVHQIVKGTP